ncbi:MAG TPA: twin-arginine translocase TatA/TatE family subunit [Candidatus Thiothrix moscowensis]|uniref:twin-arginine translocase TatA/TatE family subunit n=1 Tax=unclassified Thiothrix TaxID=2636184 RepID=UPI001A2F0F35|nr:MULTISPECIES: twin-arginine translocase TatA/TatE family subunit [unclassified Thiothrix]MBJ6608809.1 twin-arginine translocase TatA/TatE family subunit [Candidatus Thiothrix moscowensis]HRJ51785.1 twin-arginine translocase TatA/TatE family subunit [Candidatus Thiothrix moscowensis]HRJ92100.1 twin-arginine translocase TatA/TatE family subunit [Candidatus Thiothrix moscowensis]
MGLGGISPWSLLLILVIILLLFGTKRLRNMGSDLGETFKNFRNAMKTGEEEQTNTPTQQVNQQQPPVHGNVIDSEAKVKDKV